TRSASRRMRALRFREQTYDRLFDVVKLRVACVVAGPLPGCCFMELDAGMNVSNDAALVDYERHRGRAALPLVQPPAVQSLPVCIQGDRKVHVQALGSFAHPLDAPVARGLGMEDADYLQTQAAIFCLQLLKRGRRCRAERAGVGPPANQDDSAAQVCDFKGRGVHPALQREPRSGGANTVGPFLHREGGELRLLPENNQG